ncbi:hypothetical protein ABK040_006851 [Willaertia magna]
MAKRSCIIVCLDGVTLNATLFFPEDNTKYSSNCVLISPAMGVPSNFYFDFATHLTTFGFSCLCFDYRGCFSSKNGVNNSMLSLRDWGAKDIPALLDYLEKVVKTEILGVNDLKIIYLSHSIGGQLLSFCPLNYLEKLSAVVSIASQSGYYGLWPLVLPRLTMLVYWYLLLPLYCKIYKNNVPMLKVPSKVVTDWYSSGRCENYIFDYFKITTNPSSVLSNIPVTFFSIENDFYAPFTAVNWLFKKYTNIQNVKSLTNFNDLMKYKDDFHVLVSVEGLIAKKIGHFNFFREKISKELIWNDFIIYLQYLLENLERKNPPFTISKL